MKWMHHSLSRVVVTQSNQVCRYVRTYVCTYVLCVRLTLSFYYFWSHFHIVHCTHSRDWMVESHVNFYCVQHLRLYHFPSVLIAVFDVQLGLEVATQLYMANFTLYIHTYMYCTETMPNLLTHCTLLDMWCIACLRSLSGLNLRSYVVALVVQTRHFPARRDM